MKRAWQLPAATRWALVVLAVSASGSGAQSLNRDIEWGYQQFLTREYRPFWDERYENLSLLSYRNFPIRPERPTYDPFGTYLLDGSELLRVEEYRTIDPTNSSRIPSGPSLGQFRNLVIMHDHYKNWSTRFMIGQRLPAHLAPMSHARAIFDGIRWDASSHRNMISVLTSRVSHRPSAGPRTIPFGTYLYAGRWQSQLGDIATFGATYANAHIRDTSQRKGDFRGVFPAEFDPSGSYFVIISDDSPEDGVGPLVYDVEAIANGVRVDGPPDVRLVADVVRVEDVAHIRQQGAWAVLSMPKGRLLKETQPGRGRYYSEGIPVVVDNRVTQVSGTDLLVYRFEVPPETERVQFRVLASGDYSLDVGASFPQSGLAERAWTDWHNLVRAPGNVHDGSNLGWVRLEYGFPTGLTNLGIDIAVDLWGTQVRGEFVNNTANYQLPIIGGHKRRRTNAWFINGVKAFDDHWRVGGEVYRMPHDYVNALPMWSHSANKALDYDMVEDNDDRDEWPDKYEHWDPLHPTYVINKGNDVDVDSQLSQVSRDYGYGGDFTYGVYPGLDEDQDGEPDTNVNQNEFADHTEPFLMYFTEPDAFAYGDDFNNNGVVDNRENDNRPDYPYNLDSEGYHVFGAFRGFDDALSGRVGRYEMDQDAGYGRNHVTYLEVGYTRRLQRLGRVNLRLRTKRVRDDIADPTYVSIVEPLSTTNRAIAIRPDHLLMVNSLATTAFAKSEYDEIAGLTVVNATKLDVNKRRDDRIAGDTITDWTWVSKADYHYPLGEHFTFTPMAKLLIERLGGPNDLIADRHTYELFPILRLDVALSEDTVLRGGVQGFPFKHRYRHRESTSSDFDARHYVIAFQTQRSYTGYNLNINVGLRRSREELINLRAGQDQEFTQFFVQARIL